MSSSSGGAASGGMPRLGPAWRSSGPGAGRGFQPPPAVPDAEKESRERSGSGASGGSGSYPRASSTGAKSGGRSLADLLNRGGGAGAGGASPTPPHHRANDHRSSDHRSTPRSASTGIARTRSGSGEGLGHDSRGGDRASNDDLPVDSGPTKVVIRYTREKILSLRGRGDDPIPDSVKELEGSVVVSKAAQDPVCWDTFDAEEIWASINRDRRSSDPRSVPNKSAQSRLRDLDSGDEGAGIASPGGRFDAPPAGRFDAPPAGRFDASPAGRFDVPPGGRFDGGGEGERGRFDAGGRIEGHRGSGMSSPMERGSLGERGIERPRGSIGSNMDPRTLNDRNDRGPSGGGGFGSGRWQRGVALPADDARANSSGRAENRERDNRAGREDTNDPDDLWDDPAPGGAGAATDFSAFGGSLEDDHPKGRTGMEAFEMSDMSKAAADFENELHGGVKKSDKKSDNGDSGDAAGAAEGGISSIGEGGGDDALALGGIDESFSHDVDPSRPLASTGTTIRSGSGDGVNVFEDFGDDGPGGEKGEGEDGNAPIKSGNTESNASSRLMKMIGVAGTGEASSGGSVGGEPTPPAAADAEVKPEESEPGDEAAAVPSNPWGAPASSVSSNPWGDAPSSGGFGNQQAEDAEAKASAAAAAAQRQRQEEELLRQQQQQQQQAAVQAKQAAELQAAKQAAEMQAAAAASAQQQQRQNAENQVTAQQKQVELVLIERISNILENSWGRSDLTSILSTLHSMDSRVIAILGTVEGLRALMARHPTRIQLGMDPTMGAEMAALRVTNAQFAAQAAQDQAQLAAAQQQELARRRQLQEEQAKQQQEAMARAQAEEQRKKQQQAQQQVPPVTDAPWFYADPQGNIQGPFGGDEMRQWLEAGYFKGDLPISQNNAGPFRTLSSYFSNAGKAFQPTPVNTPSLEDNSAEVKARAEAEAAAEANARAEAEAAALAAEEA
eukprot:CAMPEP_0172297246 /NCGR_PEP_ID=MMETSP1058-20130122/343_1 /TAXON_ID=83371 /ORGANISM="Detonula confervacea, Strain CCMP 353" /LENGTH=954 /DNA_ID=CAMNT_0013006375 /DNA_START=61 /DNA_END=2922 /DNA_ORIENTATION=-